VGFYVNLIKNRKIKSAELIEIPNLFTLFMNDVQFKNP
jgi:hypothetical protein